MTSLSPRIIAVPTEALVLAGDGNAAIFLAQVLFWWKTSGRRKFYKFNAACDHDLYRAGDSWMEELRLTRTILATARRRVAVKVQYIHHEEIIQAAFDEGAMIVYGTDRNRLTWYVVNESALAVRAPTLFARLTGTGAEASSDSSAPQTKTLPQQTPSRQVVVTPPAVTSQTNTAFSQSSDPALSNAGVLHSPMQDPCIGYIPESITETAPENSLQKNPIVDTPLPTPITLTPAGRGGADKTAQSRIAKTIFDKLQSRGVQRDPARLIALRAARFGWSIEKTLEIFSAHVLDAERAEARSPVGVAVSRMLDGDTITPAPNWAIARVRRQRQEQQLIDQGKQDIAARRNGAKGEELETEGGVLIEEEPTSPVTALWQRVLDDIKLHVTRATFEQRFRNTWLEQRNDTYVVCARDPHTVEWLEHRLHRIVASALQRWGIAELSIGFSVSGGI